jgi:hypothetical protein
MNIKKIIMLLTVVLSISSQGIMEARGGGGHGGGGHMGGHGGFHGGGHVDHGGFHGGGYNHHNGNWHGNGGYRGGWGFYGASVVAPTVNYVTDDEEYEEPEVEVEDTLND